MPIINSVYTGKKLFASEFFCPNCFAVRPYGIKPMTKEMTFNVVPFLESNEASHVIECLVVCWLNNARNSLLDLAERSRVGHPLKTGDQPCVVESPKNSS